MLNISNNKVFKTNFKRVCYLGSVSSIRNEFFHKNLNWIEIYFYYEQICINPENFEHNFFNLSYFQKVFNLK